MNPRTLLTGGTLLARFILGLVFAISAAGKITAPGLFRTTVENYHMLPQAVLSPFAYGLPYVEALLAVYLLLGLFLRFAGMATAAFLLVFTVALGVQIVRGNVNLNCGCLPSGGPLASLPLVQWLAGGATIGWFDVCRDMVFLALAVLVALGDHTTLSLDGWRRAGIDDEDDDTTVDAALPAVGGRRL